MRYQAIALALITAAALSISPASAKEHEKERYLETSVGVNNKPVKIKIDPATSKVAYFWNDGTKEWADASLYPGDLDRLYEEKIALLEMQGELDEMRDETWDDRYRGGH